MARTIVIGGIESTFRNAQILCDLGENIVMFYTRGPRSPGWEGVEMIDETRFAFASNVPRSIVSGNINEHLEEMRALEPDVIYSLGWQQVYGPKLLALCKFVGIHESLLPKGAGAVPIANAILHDVAVTGCTLFWLDAGMDTGPIIGQLRGRLDPRTANATALYEEAMQLGGELLRMFVPHINAGTAPAIPQDASRRTVYRKVKWDDWSVDRVIRAKVYPYA
jgi:methionyl-tRNA formyltransferase